MAQEQQAVPNTSASVEQGTGAAGAAADCCQPAALLLEEGASLPGDNCAVLMNLGLTVVCALPVLTQLATDYQQSSGGLT